MKVVSSLLFTGALVALLAACSRNDTERPYLEFAGGGFIFNYRLATADYGFVVKVLRRLPDGAVIEAEFEDPSGGPPIVIREPARPSRIYYRFQTPPVTGIRAGNDYRVEVRLIKAESGQVIARYARSFHADVDQSILPDAPPVVGPGYQRNPTFD